MAEQTQEERIQQLEKAVEELRKQMKFEVSEVNRNATILLGLATRGYEDTKLLVEKVTDIRSGLDQIGDTQREHSTDIETLKHQLALLDQKIDTRFDQLFAILQPRYPQGRE